MLRAHGKRNVIRFIVEVESSCAGHEAVPGVGAASGERAKGVVSIEKALGGMEGAEASVDGFVLGVRRADEFS